jgi:hypothetical protein
MRVFAWRENAATPTSFDVDIPTWSEDPATYKSLTLGGINWLERVDGRIVAATRAGDQLWFGWTAGAGGVNARPNPYVQIAVVDPKQEKLLDSINLWDPQNAAACPLSRLTATTTSALATAPAGESNSRHTWWAS